MILCSLLGRSKGPSITAVVQGFMHRSWSPPEDIRQYALITYHVNSQSMQSACLRSEDSVIASTASIATIPSGFTEKKRSPQPMKRRRSGDLCTMEGLMQKHYLHRVPKAAVSGPGPSTQYLLQVPCLAGFWKHKPQQFWVLGPFGIVRARACEVADDDKGFNGQG